MKKILLVMVMILVGGGKSVSAQTAPVGQSGTWNLVFADEFNTTKVDTKKWNNGYLWGAADTNMGNASLTNSTQNKGILYLKAKGTISNFTVGALTSKQAFGKGYYEARIKVPAGKGAWPAFWLYDGVWETDIMEFLGNHPFYYYSAWHYNGNAPQSSYQSSVDLTKDFHVYGAEITDSEVIFYFDGLEFWRYAAAMNTTPKITLDNGIMCSMDWDGNKCDTTTFANLPQTQVDWVRVWTR